MWWDIYINVSEEPFLFNFQVGWGGEVYIVLWQVVKIKSNFDNVYHCLYMSSRASILFVFLSNQKVTYNMQVSKISMSSTKIQCVDSNMYIAVHVYLYKMWSFNKELSVWLSVQYMPSSILFCIDMVITELFMRHVPSYYLKQHGVHLNPAEYLNDYSVKIYTFQMIRKTL